MAFPLVQLAQAQSTSGTTEASHNVTVSPTIYGSSLVVVCQARTNSTNPTITVTDNQSNTYATIAGTSLSLGAQGTHQWFLLQNAPQNINTITVNVGTNSWVAAQVFEIQKLQGSDKVVQSTATSTNPTTGPTATISQDDEFIIGATGAHTSAALGAASGYTMQSTLVSSVTPIAELATGYAVNSRFATTYSWSTTLASSVWVATIVTFKVIQGTPVVNRHLRPAIFKPGQSAYGR